MRTLITIHRLQQRFSLLGCPGDAPIHAHFELVLWQHVLPHDNRQSGERIQAAVRDLPWLQDGRPAHELHLAHAHQHE